MAAFRSGYLDLKVAVALREEVTMGKAEDNNQLREELKERGYYITSDRPAGWNYDGPKSPSGNRVIIGPGAVFRNKLKESGWVVTITEPVTSYDYQKSKHVPVSPPKYEIRMTNDDKRILETMEFGLKEK